MWTSCVLQHKTARRKENTRNVAVFKTNNYALFRLRFIAVKPVKVAATKYLSKFTVHTSNITLRPAFSGDERMNECSKHLTTSTFQASRCGISHTELFLHTTNSHRNCKYESQAYAVVSAVQSCYCSGCLIAFGLIPLSSNFEYFVSSTRCGKKCDNFQIAVLMNCLECN